MMKSVPSDKYKSNIFIRNCLQRHTQQLTLNRNNSEKRELQKVHWFGSKLAIQGHFWVV